MDNEIKSALSDEKFKRCMGKVGEMDGCGDLRTLTAMFLMLTDGSYFIADGRASKLVQEAKSYRTSYSGYSIELMANSFDPEEDPETNAESVKILAAALNSYMKRYKHEPDMSTDRGQSEYKELATLLIQILVRGFTNQTDYIEIPDWINEKYKECLDLIEQGADQAFSNWINDLRELDNENLVDYIESIGPEMFGTEVTTKANLYYEAMMRPYVAQIKNPIALYERWKLRRDEYKVYTINLQNSKFFDIFGITESEFTNAQKRIYNDFSIFYNEDVNVQYLIQMLND